MLCGFCSKKNKPIDDGKVANYCFKKFKSKVDGEPKEKCEHLRLVIKKGGRNERFRRKGKTRTSPR